MGWAWWQILVALFLDGGTFPPPPDGAATRDGGTFPPPPHP